MFFFTQVDIFKNPNILDGKIDGFPRYFESNKKRGKIRSITLSKTYEEDTLMSRPIFLMGKLELNNENGTTQKWNDIIYVGGRVANLSTNQLILENIVVTYRTRRDEYLPFSKNKSPINNESFGSSLSLSFNENTGKLTFESGSIKDFFQLGDEISKYQSLANYESQRLTSKLESWFKSNHSVSKSGVTTSLIAKGKHPEYFYNVLARYADSTDLMLSDTLSVYLKINRYGVDDLEFYDSFRSLTLLINEILSKKIKTNVETIIPLLPNLKHIQVYPS